MALTPTEEGFLKDLRHLEQRFSGAKNDADKQYYADLAMLIWRAIALYYEEKPRAKNALDKGGVAE